MEEERVNLYVTKCQLDLILESTLCSSYSWKRTHDAFMKGDDDASDVEECTTECEADFMQEGYEKLCEEGEPCGRSLVKGHESMGRLDGTWRRVRIWSWMPFLRFY